MRDSAVQNEEKNVSRGGAENAEIIVQNEGVGCPKCCLKILKALCSATLQSVGVLGLGLAWEGCALSQPGSDTVATEGNPPED